MSATDHHTLIPLKRQEIRPLTSIRGYAAIWVVLFHYWNDVLALFPESAVLSPLIRLGHLAVPMFFVLSGYVLGVNYFDQFHTLSFSQCKSYLTKRLLRIYPLHFVTLMVVLAMYLATLVAGISLDHSGYTITTFFQNLLLVQTWVPHFRLSWNYPSWSISSEWAAYLAFPLVCLLLHRIGSRTVLGGLMLICVAATLYLYGNNIIGKILFGELLCIVPTFLFGLLASILFTSTVMQNWPRSATITWGLFGLALFCAYIPHRPTAVMCVVALLLTIVVWLSAPAQNNLPVLTSNVSMLLGKASYALYLTHGIVQKLINALLPSQRFAESSLAVRTLVLGSYVVAIALAAVIAHVLVDTALRRRLQNWMRKSPVKAW